MAQNHAQNGTKHAQNGTPKFGTRSRKLACQHFYFVGKQRFTQFFAFWHAGLAHELQHQWLSPRWRFFTMNDTVTINGTEFPINRPAKEVFALGLPKLLFSEYQRLCAAIGSEDRKKAKAAEKAAKKEAKAAERLRALNEKANTRFGLAFVDGGYVATVEAIVQFNKTHHIHYNQLPNASLATATESLLLSREAAFEFIKEVGFIDCGKGNIMAVRNCSIYATSDCIGRLDEQLYKVGAVFAGKEAEPAPNRALLNHAFVLCGNKITLKKLFVDKPAITLTDDGIEVVLPIQRLRPVVSKDYVPTEEARKLLKQFKQFLCAFVKAPNDDPYDNENGRRLYNYIQYVIQHVYLKPKRTNGVVLILLGEKNTFKSRFVLNILPSVFSIPCNGYQKTQKRGVIEATYDYNKSDSDVVGKDIMNCELKSALCVVEDLTEDMTPSAIAAYIKRSATTDMRLNRQPYQPIATCENRFIDVFVSNREQSKQFSTVIADKDFSDKVLVLQAGGFIGINSEALAYFSFLLAQEDSPLVAALQHEALYSGTIYSRSVVDTVTSKTETPWLTSLPDAEESDTRFQHVDYISPFAASTISKKMRLRDAIITDCRKEARHGNGTLKHVVNLTFFLRVLGQRTFKGSVVPVEEVKRELEAMNRLVIRDTEGEPLYATVGLVDDDEHEGNLAYKLTYREAKNGMTTYETQQHA